MIWIFSGKRHHRVGDSYFDMAEEGAISWAVGKSGVTALVPRATLVLVPGDR